MVEQLQIEGLGKQNDEAEQPNKVQKGPEKAVEENVAKVLEHELQIDFTCCVHNENRQNEIQKQGILGSLVECVVAFLINSRSRGSVQSKSPEISPRSIRGNNGGSAFAFGSRTRSA